MLDYHRDDIAYPEEGTNPLELLDFPHHTKRFADSLHFDCVNAVCDSGLFRTSAKPGFAVFSARVGGSRLDYLVPNHAFERLMGNSIP